jgi:hypothetical protein
LKKVLDSNHYEEVPNRKAYDLEFFQHIAEKDNKWFGDKNHNSLSLLIEYFELNYKQPVPVKNNKVLSKESIEKSKMYRKDRREKRERRMERLAKEIKQILNPKVTVKRKSKVTNYNVFSNESIENSKMYRKDLREQKRMQHLAWGE